MESYHPFFREKAVKEYRHRQERAVLPRFFSPYLAILTYLLFFLLLLVGILAWWGEIPSFVTGSGVVRAERAASASQSQNMTIVLFLPARYVSQIHLGEKTQVTLEPEGLQFTSTIERVEAKSLSPGEARQRYLLNDVAAQAIPQSAVAAILLPVTTGAPHIEAGDLVSAQVHVGSQRILSFLLGEQETNRGG
jgi:hypothetical protein